MQLAVISEIKRHKIRAVKTLITCLNYICLGLHSSVIGVALLDLKVLAGCDLNQITLTVTGRAIGYAAGSVISGFIDSYINTQLTLMVCLFAGAVIHVAIPLARSLLLMAILCGFAGFSNGVADCAANIFIIKLWAKECPPFIQALHFCYGVGSLVVSLLVEPYLKEDLLDDDTNSTINAANGTKILTPEDIQLLIPYSMIAVISAAVGLLFLAMFIFARETTDHPSRNAPVVEQSKDGSRVEVIRNVKPKMRIFVILLTSFFMLFYVGLEKTIGTFIPAFGHDGPLQLPKKSGALISAVYWITFTSFRLIAVFLSGIFGSLPVLIFNISITILATIFMCAIQTSEPVFWASCALIGIGLSSTWGSLFGFMESQFPLSGKIVSCFTVGACLGSSFVPAVIGMLMANNNEIFAWFCLVFSLLIALMFAVIYVICRTILFTEERRRFKSQISIISQPKC